jgi:hypothetical protein
MNKSLENYSMKFNFTRTLKVSALSILTIIVGFGMTVSSVKLETFTSGLIPTALAADTVCEISADAVIIYAGSDVTISWHTEGFSEVLLNGVSVPTGEGVQTFTNVQVNTTYTLEATTESGDVNCNTSVSIVCLTVPPPTCLLTPTAVTVASGSSVTLEWSTTDAEAATLTNFGIVDTSGSVSTGVLTSDQTYVLQVTGTSGEQVSCSAVIIVTPLAPLSCGNQVVFGASPTRIDAGQSSTLNWSASGIDEVRFVNQGIPTTGLQGSATVSPATTTVYTLTGYRGLETVSCPVTVEVVTDSSLPFCDSFSASPSIIVPGGSATLAWGTSNANRVVINNGIGQVLTVDGTMTVTPLSSVTYLLTAYDANGRESLPCTASVTVSQTPLAPDCTAFTATPATLPVGGGSVSLAWTSVGGETAAISPEVGAVPVSGSQNLTISTDTTFTLLITGANNTSDSCSVTVPVETSGGGGGGGGGGSSSPTCELSASERTINRGETVTLSYDSSRATEVELVDVTNADVLVTTRGKLSKDKSEFYDGLVEVTPTQDTQYTLTVERGSRDRVCSVTVAVADSVVISQIRDQQPLVAGISLIDVPYTGFAAGPIMTMSFYVLLMAWALYLAYILVIQKNVLGGRNQRFAEAHIVADRMQPEDIRPDVFVASVRTPSASIAQYVPGNLPTATPVVVGYEQSAEAAHISPVATSDVAIDEKVTALENHAHAKRALLSSDAIRHLLGATQDLDEGIATLNEVITEAKTKYPSEDGWVVINEKRMRDLCLVCQAKPVPSSAVPYVPVVIPEGSGSLAEAIVTGNIIAAYEMIGNRPMFALADASADLDAIYRARKTGATVGSTMLQSETAHLSNEQILDIIKALTSALDGVYTDEASAVKMAIMKAVKVVA